MRNEFARKLERTQKDPGMNGGADIKMARKQKSGGELVLATAIEVDD